MKQVGSQDSSLSKTRKVSDLIYNLTPLKTVLVIEKKADLTIWYIVGGIVGFVIFAISIIVTRAHIKEKDTNKIANHERKKGVAQWGTKTNFALDLEGESSEDNFNNSKKNVH